MTLQRIMRILPVLVCALSIAASGCGRPDAPASDAFQTAAQSDTGPRGALAAPRIVFLGDSLTAGLGLAKEQSVPSLIQARLNAEGYDYEVINAGVSGDTSAGGLSRLD